LQKGQEVSKMIATTQLASGIYSISVLDEKGIQLEIQKVIISR